MHFSIISLPYINVRSVLAPLNDQAGFIYCTSKVPLYQSTFIYLFEKPVSINLVFKKFEGIEIWNKNDKECYLNALNFCYKPTTPFFLNDLPWKRQIIWNWNNNGHNFPLNLIGKIYSKLLHNGSNNYQCIFA